MIDIEYDNDTGVIFTLSGEFSYNEVEYSLIELFKSQNFKNLQYLLMDRSNSIKYSMTTQQVKKLANLCISASNINKKLAHILVSKTDFEFGMSRMLGDTRKILDGISKALKN